MRKFRKRERRWALVKTMIACVGWGLLGYVVMTSYEGLFWLGWVTLLVAGSVGAVSMDKLMECCMEGF